MAASRHTERRSSPAGAPGRRRRQRAGLSPRRRFAVLLPFLLLLVAPALAGNAIPSVASPADSPEPLEPGVSLDRDARRLPAHAYTVDLAADDYARVVVTMQGAALRIVVRSPAGAEVLRVTSPSDRYGDLAAAVVAAGGGRYTFEVAPQSATEAAAGSYRIVLAARRPAHAADRLRTAAETDLAAAVEHLYQGSPDDLARALELSRGTLPTWSRLADRGGEAAACYLAGESEILANQPAAAAPLFARAADLWRQLGDRGGEGKALHQIGRVRRYQGDTRGALAAFRQALALQEAADRPYSVAHTLYNLARLQADLGDLPGARAAFERAMGIYRAQGDRSGEALILDALGGADEREGRATQALDDFTRALALARGLDNPSLEAEAQDRLGRLDLRLGLVHQAVESLAAAAESYRAAHDPANEGLARVDLGGLLAEMGEGDAAQAALAGALPLLRDPRDQARARLLLARVAQAQERPRDAATLAEQALATSRAMAHPEGEAAALRTLGFLHLGGGEAARAGEELRQALALASAGADLAGQAEAWLGLAQVDAGGDAPAAARALAAALALARQAADATDEIRVLEEMARQQQARGDLAAARTAIEQALTRIESLHAEAAGDQLRVAYLAAQRRAYEMEIDILLQLDRADPAAGLGGRALEVAERARARGMLDFLREARVELRQGDPALVQLEERLRLELNAKAALRGEALAVPARAAEVAALDADLAALATRYEIAAERLAASSPDYALLQQPDVRLADLQQQALDDDTVLLEYFLAEPHSHLWRLTARSLASFELPGRSQIEALAHRVHDQLAAPRQGGGAAAGLEAGQDLAALGRLLLAPVAGSLGGKRVAVVADGALLYVPFGALPEPPESDPKLAAGCGAGPCAGDAATATAAGQPLLAAHEVIELPSAAVVRELRRARAARPAAPETLAVLADPVFDLADPRVRQPAAGGGAGDGESGSGAPTDRSPAAAGAAVMAAPADGAPRDRGAAGESFARLPWTRREAQMAAAEAGDRQVLLALDFQASRELATTGALARYRVLHFATHGVLDTRHPALSGLVLSRVDEQGRPREGFLRVDDVYRLRLGADLVVLSGCETALGATVRGEGILGLTRAFFHAGASQVLASLWPVRDRATAELMQRFYRAMLRDGRSPAAALRQAQLDLRQQPRWRDPYYWAGFILEGDWRVPAP